MTSRRKLRQLAEDATAAASEANERAEGAHRQVIALQGEMARLRSQHADALQAQRDEHAAVQRGHLADLARAREESLRAIHRDLLAELDEAKRERDHALHRQSDLAAQVVQTGEVLDEVVSERDRAVHLARLAITNRDPSARTLRRWQHDLDVLAEGRQG